MCFPAGGISPVDATEQIFIQLLFLLTGLPPFPRSAGLWQTLRALLRWTLRGSGCQLHPSLAPPRHESGPPGIFRCSGSCVRQHDYEQPVPATAPGQKPSAISVGVFHHCKKNWELQLLICTGWAQGPSAEHNTHLPGRASLPQFPSLKGDQEHFCGRCRKNTAVQSPPVPPALSLSQPPAGDPPQALAGAQGRRG